MENEEFTPQTQHPAEQEPLSSYTQPRAMPATTERDGAANPVMNQATSVTSPQGSFEQPDGKTRIGMTPRKPVFKDRRFWAGVAAGLAIGFILGIALLGGIAAYQVHKSDTTFSSVMSSCPLPEDSSSEISLGDDGNSISVFIPADTLDDSGTKTHACIQKELKTPSGVVSKMGQTTGFDGQQSDSWGNIKVTWSFNGNSGFHAVYELNDK